jgi:phage terminase large subunit
MRIKSTVVYEYCEEGFKSGSSILVFQGGARASKTYNILIWLISNALKRWNNEIIDIGRKTFPSLRASIMFDFFEILKKNNLYYEQLHDKTNHNYKIGSNTFRFFSVDQETKVRGSKRSFLFMNEANEFSYDDFKQLNMRTTKLTILDYNPSDEFHWIYDNILNREDCKFYKTTFLDNPFLPKRIIDEIKAYKKIDPNYWRIYGLGEKGISGTTIFPHWQYADKPFDEYEGELLYGQDYGFNDPTTLVRVKYHKKGIVIDELLYKSELTSDMIVNELIKLKDKGLIKFTDKIVGDSARPEIIKDIYKAGFNIFSAKKGKDSVLRDINFLKKHPLYITKESVNLIKEVKSYKWKVDKNGKILDEPVDVSNHILDGIRYALEDYSAENSGKVLMLDGSDNAFF